MTNKTTSPSSQMPMSTMVLVIGGFVLGLAGLFFGVPIVLVGCLLIGIGSYRSATHYVACGAPTKYAKLTGVLALIWFVAVSSFWALYLRAAHLAASQSEVNPDPAIDEQLVNLRNLMMPLLGAGLALLIVLAWVLLRMASQAAGARLLGVNANSKPSPRPRP